MTIISDSKKFIFFRPRCHATTSIETYMHENLTPSDYINCSSEIRRGNEIYKNIGTHISCSKFKQQFPLKYKEYFKFTVVRNPWDHVVSYFYSFILNEGKNKEKNKGSKLDVRKIFQKWLIKKWYKTDSFNVEEEFLYNKIIHYPYHFIIRYENLDDDFRKICCKLNLGKRSHKRKNKVLKHTRYNSSKNHYSFYYDEQCKKLVEERFKNTIDRFNYNFTSL